MSTDKDIVIFGAGQIGRMALAKWKQRVLFIVDNNKKLHGTFIDGIQVKGVESLSAQGPYTVLIASKNQELMERQLQKLGIKRYGFYLKESRAYYDTESLIVNPYEDNFQRNLTEEKWNEKNKDHLAKETINFRVGQLKGKEVLFDHVEIETVNRCNGSCEFCPVNKNNDKRVYQEMSAALFENIINQLADMNYSGKLALFSNNEPFLDPDIIRKHKYAREKLPLARMHLFTNGTLLTIEKFVQIVEYLDELIIDNYHQELHLIRPCQEIVTYCEKHTELKKKVTIVLRKPKEILTSRGGDAPNRKKLVSYENLRCILPYKQFIIRPDGKVSLCCNDPYGRNTLGDLSKETMMEVWFNDRFKMIRKCLYEGRKNWEHCKYCDVLALG